MKLFNIDKYLLLIDENGKIKDRGICLCYDKLTKEPHLDYFYEEDWDYYVYKPSCILAYYPLLEDAKELDLPLLPNPFEAYNKEMALRAYPIDQFEDDFDYRFRLGFEAGFKDKFTLEDIKRAISMARLISDKSVHDEFEVEDISGLTEICTYDWKNKYSDEEIIKSLQFERLPKEFIIEYNYYPIGVNRNIIGTNKPYPFEGIIADFKIKEIPKIILNSKKKQICGTYKW